MHMRKLFIGFAVVFGVALACVPSALAEFKSEIKGSQGKGYFSSLQLKAGGAVVECSSNLGSESANTWIIEKGTEHAEKGPGLLVKLNTWTKCIAEASGFKEEGTVKGSGCEIETKEPKAEEKILGTFTSTCAFKFETLGVTTCEMDVEPTSNKELKEVDLAHSGENDENLILEFASEGLTTVTKGKECEKIGINSTKKGELALTSEEADVAPETLVDEFRLARTGPPGSSLVPTGTTRTVFVKFTGGTPTRPLGNLQGDEFLGRTRRTQSDFYKVEGEFLGICQSKLYSNNEKCEMKITSNTVTTAREAAAYYWFKINFNDRHAALAFFV